MKELIEKIEINPKSLESALLWMADDNNNGLSENGLTDVVRYLLLKVVELENEINKLKSEA